MKRNLLLKWGIFGYIISIFASCISGVTPKVEPGNWQWRNANGSVNANISINTPITINTAQDVTTLRWQFLITIDNTNNSAAIINLNPYLQYLDAGSSTNGSGWTTSNNMVLPVSTYRNAGDNQPNGNTFNRFSGTGGSITSSNANSANSSQTNSWHTIADEGTVYTGTVNGSSDNSIYTPANAAFVMSSYSASVTTMTVSNLGTVGTAPSYTSLSYPVSPTPTYSTTPSASTNNAQLIVPNTNGSAASITISNTESALPIVLSIAAKSTRTVLLETEFHIKPAANAAMTAIGPKAGDRYFFRLRAFGSIGLGSYNSSTGNITFNSNSRSDFYLSPYGIGGANSNDPNLGQNSAGANSTLGFYRNYTPFPYLDINPNIYNFTLPVTYSKELTATVVNNGAVALGWATATEVNNNYFDVQRSSDQSTWTSVGTVASKVTNGTGAGTDYSLTDYSPLNGKSFYRLVQYDLDGKSETGKVVFVETVSSNSALKVIPNPAIDKIRVSGVTVGATLSIYSFAGQLVKRQIATAQTEVVNIQNLASGVYLIQIIDKTGGRQAVKFIKK